MKRTLLAVPFALTLISAAGIMSSPGAYWLGVVVWGGIASYFASILAIPILSRVRLWLGYSAIIFLTAIALVVVSISSVARLPPSH